MPGVLSPSRSFLLKIAMLLGAAALILWTGRPPAEPVTTSEAALVSVEEAGRAAPSVAPGRPPARTRAPVRVPSRPTRLDLNRASVEELGTLPGIGPVLAQRIVARRTARLFHKVDQLTEVKGIGKKRLARLRPFLMIGAGGDPAVPPLATKEHS
jgi:competence protein ComEA